MKSLSLFFYFLLFALLSLSAQEVEPLKSLPIVRDGHHTFVKKVQEDAYGLTMEVPADIEKVEGLWVKALRNASGNKPKSFKKGIYSLESSVIPDISGDKRDYYYRIEEAGSKTRITFFISHGNYNFVSPDKHPQEMEAARRWMAHLPVKHRINELIVIEEVRAETLAEISKEKEGLQEELNKTLADKTELEEELAELQTKLEAINTAYEEQGHLMEAELIKEEEAQSDLKKIQDEIARLKEL